MQRFQVESSYSTISKVPPSLIVAHELGPTNKFTARQVLTCVTENARSRETLKHDIRPCPSAQAHRSGLMDTTERAHVFSAADEQVMQLEFDELQLQHNETDENMVDESPAEPASGAEDDDEYADEDEDLEEYYSEGDERPTADDYRQYGMYPSLPIPSGPPDMEAPCDTAEEYLRRVR